MKKPSRALVAKWYAKAAKAGFEDIEQNDEPERLKKWHSTYLQSRFTPLQYESKETYYRLAAQYAEHGEFDTGRHKKIWTLHSDGLPIKAIAKTVKVSESAVYAVILKYRKNIICK